MKTKLIMDETLRGKIDVASYLCISCKKITIVVKKDDKQDVDSKCPYCKIPLKFIICSKEYVAIK